MRRVDPTQALESRGSFAAIFEICRKRVMGDKERAGRDVLPSLKAMADGLRQKNAEQLDCVRLRGWVGCPYGPTHPHPPT